MVSETHFTPYVSYHSYGMKPADFPPDSISSVRANMLLKRIQTFFRRLTLSVFVMLLHETHLKTSFIFIVYLWTGHETKKESFTEEGKIVRQEVDCKTTSFDKCCARVWKETDRGQKETGDTDRRTLKNNVKSKAKNPEYTVVDAAFHHVGKKGLKLKDVRDDLSIQASQEIQGAGE